MENSVSEVNGNSLEAQPEVPKEPQRIEGRKYCDTCKFYNLILSDNAPVTICRRNPPAVVGNFIGLQRGGQTTFQNFSATLWATVSKMDWCGEYVDDPAAVRGGGKTVSSVIATDSSRAS